MEVALHPDYSHYRRAFAGRPMPFAFLDRDLLDTNARDLLARAGGASIRVATKSIRSESILRHILGSDERFRGLMCFTAPEAVHLAERGFDDLLVAYPTVHPDHIEAVARTNAGGKRIVLTVDSLELVTRIEEIAARIEATVPLCLDIDMSWELPGLHFGVWRSPIRTADQAVRVAREIVASVHTPLDGILGYEAQIAGVPDRAPGAALRGPVIRELKRRSIKRVAERRAEVVHAVEALGAKLRFVNGGGTGSVETTVADDVVTEVTVGSGFYSPGLFDHYDGFRHHPAAAFAIEIVRRPAPDIYTCLGGGYVASGVAGPDRSPHPYLPHGVELLATEGAGEVQTPVRYRGPERLDLGDPIFLRHAKAGELCERFNHLVVLAGGEVADEVTTYRGDGLAFL